ncbi:hypothetical protein [Nocardia brasiliensis]|uniref:hypothetical protein n=1 Tax=Nocardia brasiliensis TaxID=37326 RepID=UPI002454212D|nr:hypothetical protein [Nocardia brasiliensis]
MSDLIAAAADDRAIMAVAREYLHRCADHYAHTIDELDGATDTITRDVGRCGVTRRARSYAREGGLPALLTEHAADIDQASQPVDLIPADQETA